MFSDMKDPSYTSVFKTRPAYPSRRHHLCFTGITAKLKEMQRTFHIMYKPYLAIQMARYLA